MTVFSLLCIWNKDEAAPLESLLASADESLKLTPVEVHHRQRRFMCDGFSNDTVCASYCYFIGWGSGGYCNNKNICICR